MTNQSKAFECYDELMANWKKKHNSMDYIFVEDGVIASNVWNSLSDNEERILFLLKEAYSKDTRQIKSNWSLTKWIRHEYCYDKEGICKKDCSKCTFTGNTFNPIAEWIYGIQNIKSKTPKEYDNWLGVENCDLRQYRSVREALLSQVAVVNIKKLCGKSSSDKDDLYYFTALDKNELIKQIELIAPTLIICGGTYGMLRCLYPELKELSDLNNGAIMLGNIKVIASYHPNYFAENKLKYDNVINNYKTLLKQS